MKHANTKAVRSAYRCYALSNAVTLSDVYTTASADKWRAFHECERLQTVVNGHDLRIIGANTFTFSVGFLFDHPQNKRKCFCYITPKHKRFCYIDELQKEERQ